MGFVVGADGSESSSLALEFAATEARVRSLPLEVVNTWECLTTYGGTYPDFNPKGVAPAYGVYRRPTARPSEPSSSLTSTT